eukprot:GHRQ01017981.1.p1 GENE.GHRQ01017981.1~~GHRQ01017981.1.p1  ORF type:complete len:137 (+),score=33.60 GHRQ01017981.1:179-589(+)
MAQQASGQGWTVEVTDQPLDIAKYTGLVTDPAAGAISSFIGTTRNNFQGKAVLRLEYEAYLPMAVAKLQVSWPAGCKLAVMTATDQLCVEVHGALPAAAQQMADHTCGHGPQDRCGGRVCSQRRDCSLITAPESIA